MLLSHSGDARLRRSPQPVHPMTPRLDPTCSDSWKWLLLLSLGDLKEEKQQYSSRMVSVNCREHITFNYSHRFMAAFNGHESFIHLQPGSKKIRV